MEKLVSALKKSTSVGRTENGMKTFTTSLNACLDLFFAIGASRNKSDAQIKQLFSNALHEDQKTALMILAWARDVRGGAGERRAFRVCMDYLVETDNLMLVDLSYVPEIGRWDDLFVLPFKETADIINSGLREKDGLLAKWMPRKKQYDNLRARFCKKFNLTPKEYRRLIVRLTKVVENQMCVGEWPAINYSHVPSKANVKYNKAFLRHDEERRREFLAKAKKGEAKINSSAAFPYDIVGMMVRTTGSLKEGSSLRGAVTNNDTAVAMWTQLPDYLSEKSDKIRILPICDTSGSMSGLPLQISLSLGLYLSERNVGVFKDAFITFSQRPELQYTKGNLYERLCQIKAIHPANTDLEATFELILKTAVRSGIKPSQMPTHVMIISDMEFDSATRGSDMSAIELIKSQYQAAGYKLPQIVFWNVNSRGKNIPVRYNEKGVALISGASPAVVTGVMKGKIDPIGVMLDIVNVERYQKFLR